MMGPYWPFCVSVTVLYVTLIPLILMAVLWRVLPVAVPAVFLGVTVLTLIALACTACANPGIFERQTSEVR